MLRIQLFFSTLALFIRIELLCSCILRLPPNRADEAAVFEASPIGTTNHDETGSVFVFGDKMWVVVCTLC